MCKSINNIPVCQHIVIKTKRRGKITHIISFLLILLLSPRHDHMPRCYYVIHLPSLTVQNHMCIVWHSRLVGGRSQGHMPGVKLQGKPELRCCLAGISEGTSAPVTSWQSIWYLPHKQQATPSHNQRCSLLNRRQH